MSPKEMLNFARDNNYVLELALNNNEFGYSYCPVEGELAKTRGEVSFFIRSPLPKGVQSEKIPIIPHSDNDPFLEAALVHPMNLSVIKVEFKGQTHMLFALAEDKKERSEILTEQLMLDFIENIGINTVEKLNYVCWRAEQIQNEFLDIFCEER